MGEVKQIKIKIINLLKLRLLTIIIRSVSSENCKFYPHLFLDDAIYEL